MDAPTATKTLRPKITTEMIIGFQFGLFLCMAVALAFSIWIINEQDIFIHNLLLDLSQKIVSNR